MMWSYPSCEGAVVATIGLGLAEYSAGLAALFLDL